METGLNELTIPEAKRKMEDDGKILFYKGWVCLVNFAKHNPITKIPDVQIHIADYLMTLPKDVFEFFNTKLKLYGATMSLDDYLLNKRRNQARKEIKKTKKYLMGQALEEEVDRVLGIADSGNMDWVTLVDSGKPATEYGTPESITLEVVVNIADELGVRPYQLYWLYLSKLNKLKASGRTKSDYSALLRDSAAKLAKKEFSDSEKIMAAMAYSKDLRNVTLTRSDVEIMLMTGKI
jgi:hypothetical protein